jgi:hypothetical protein
MSMYVLIFLCQNDVYLIIAASANFLPPMSTAPAISYLLHFDSRLANIFSKSIYYAVAVLTTLSLLIYRNNAQLLMNNIVFGWNFCSCSRRETNKSSGVDVWQSVSSRACCFWLMPAGVLSLFLFSRIAASVLPRRTIRCHIKSWVTHRKVAVSATRITVLHSA